MDGGEWAELETRGNREGRTGWQGMVWLLHPIPQIPVDLFLPILCTHSPLPTYFASNRQHLRLFLGGLPVGNWAEIEK